MPGADRIGERESELERKREISAVPDREGSAPVARRLQAVSPPVGDSLPGGHRPLDGGDGRASAARDGVRPRYQVYETSSVPGDPEVAGEFPMSPPQTRPAEKMTVLS